MILQHHLRKRPTQFKAVAMARSCPSFPSSEIAPKMFEVSPFFFIASPKNISRSLCDPVQIKTMCSFLLHRQPKGHFGAFSATLRNLKLYVYHQERFPRNSSSLAAPHPSPRSDEADGHHRHRQRINGLVFNGCSHETLPAYVPPVAISMFCCCPGALPL